MGDGSFPEINSMKKSEKYSEFEGRTVEDAIKKAIKILNVPREAIKVQVVCEEKRGLFGMEGAKLAKIKVMLKQNTLKK